ncbi:cadherin EGF LAG seven-pass G-type receptor 1-like [Amphibalanus amphitrite]|uniref:cadherin EGF LAG seven-pass G-type receptor 1-like n=1 Tax=Amphibalanus amphitrite TaxID=1232801 RepID=UPI001C9061AE|nr:cadherin EGF LAG seven-pass G-type receptor 1-like [Amphibalanus amphitrite]
MLVSTHHQGHHATNGTMTGEEALGLAIVLGSSFSIVGVVFSFITYSLFSDMRNLSGINLVNFLAGLFLAQLLFVIGADGVKTPEMCRALSLGLQYCHLAVFTWMAVMLLDMYRHCRSSVNLAANNNTNIKTDFFWFSLAGWGTPLVLVGIQLALLSSDIPAVPSDSPAAAADTSGCWWGQQPALVYTYTAPVFLLVLASLVCLLKAAVVVRYAVSMQIDRKVKEKMRRKRCLQLLLHGKLLLLLTLVAVMGTVSAAGDSQVARGAYGLLHSLLGLVVTLCLTCNCKVLRLYTKTWRQSRHVISDYGASGSGRSASMEALALDAPEVV